jgi:hypothetical protein
MIPSYLNANETNRAAQLNTIKKKSEAEILVTHVSIIYIKPASVTGLLVAIYFEDIYEIFGESHHCKYLKFENFGESHLKIM